MTATTTKPDWVEAEFGVDYEDIVKSWGFTVLDLTQCGSYQGDFVVLLADGDRRGFTQFGYGSCSGCDVLEAVAPWGDGPDDDWSAVENLRRDMADGIRWYDSPGDLASYLLALDEGNEWWLHDSEVKGIVSNYIVRLEGEAAK